MSQRITRFKRWFWSHPVQDQLRSTTVDILWIAFTLADGNLADFFLSLYSGNFASLTVSGVAVLLSRILIRAGAFYVLKKAKAKFPDLALPRDFATDEPVKSFTSQSTPSFTQHSHAINKNR